jgi:hypothetical protein
MFSLGILSLAICRRQRGILWPKWSIQWSSSLLAGAKCSSVSNAK